MTYNLSEIKEAIPPSLLNQWNQLTIETVENKKKITVCIVGAFSVGKSSLINMLLNKKNLLPTALKETTTLPTFIQYGKKMVLSLTDSSGCTESVDEKKFHKAVITHGEPGSFATVTIPEKWLKGIYLTDLPGTGSTEKIKTDFTNTQIRAADAIIYMINPKGPRKEDIIFLKMIHDLGKKVLTIVAQWDIAKNSEVQGESLPDLQVWEDIIEKQTGYKIYLIPSSQTGIGREKILKFFTDIENKTVTIRQKRFQHEAIPFLEHSVKILEEEKIFMESKSEEKATAFKIEIQEKRQLLLKIKKNLNTEQKNSWEHTNTKITEHKEHISETLKNKLNELKINLLNDPSKTNWEIFLGNCNKCTKQTIAEFALTFRNIYEKYGEPPDFEEEFEILNFKYPNAPVVETDDLVSKSELIFLDTQINQIICEIEQSKTNLPIVTENDDREELIKQIRLAFNKQQELENTEIPMIPTKVGGSNIGKAIGKIAGECADIGIMFIDPALIGIKAANIVGKGAKAAKIAKNITKGVKAGQVIHKGMKTVQKHVEQIPLDNVEEKAGFLEKLSLGYWGEQIGGFFDTEPLTVWSSDIESLNQKNQLLLENQANQQQLQMQLAQIQESINKQELTQYQLKTRKKELDILQAKNKELENNITKQRQEDVKKAERLFIDSVVKCADQAINNFIYETEQKSFDIKQILDTTFKNYWKNEISNAMDEHDQRLNELQQSLKTLPKDREKKFKTIAHSIDILKKSSMTIALH